MLATSRCTVGVVGYLDSERPMVETAHGMAELARAVCSGERRGALRAPGVSLVGLATVTRAVERGFSLGAERIAGL